MNEKQVDQALELAERVVKVIERWSSMQYSESDEIPEATISRVGDRSIPQSPEEYRSFEPSAEGKRSHRF